MTTDAVFEGVHFKRPFFSFEDIGHKALAVNLSDLAAMGARPSWFVCAIAAPELEAAEVRALAKGMGALAKTHGIALAGGNFSRAAELSITITAAGTVEPGRALLRRGAEPGDFVYVSGTLGDAALALRAARKGKAGDRQRRPLPRVSLGLLARRFASAAIDISDGFAQDLGHLCASSLVRAEIEADSLPRSRSVLRERDEGLSLALSGGEDYELIFTIPARKARAFEAACARAKERITRVGRVVEGNGVEVRSSAGRVLAPAGGHDHFR